MDSFEINNTQNYYDAYGESVADPKRFWGRLAKNNFLWKRTWETVLEFDFSIPKISWFKGAQLNITENCIDHQLGIE